MGHVSVIGSRLPNQYRNHKGANLVDTFSFISSSIEKAFPACYTSVSRISDRTLQQNTAEDVPSAIRQQ